MKALVEGTFFCTQCGKISWSKTQAELDKAQNTTPESRTAKVLVDVINSLEPELRFTKEVAEDFESMKLPTLDYELWTEWVEHDDTEGRTEQPAPNQDAEQSDPPEPHGVSHEAGREHPEDTQHEQQAAPRQKTKFQAIRYKFFQKPVASRYFTLERSAMSYNQNRAMLAQELVRRLLNTSRELPQAEKNTIIREFIKKVRRSGYTKHQIRDIVVSGLRENKTKWVCLKKRHRSKDETEGPRRLSKLTGKSTWFRTKKNQPKPMSNPQGMKVQNKHRAKPPKVPTLHQHPSSFVERSLGGTIALALAQ